MNQAKRREVQKQLESWCSLKKEFLKVYNFIQKATVNKKEIIFEYYMRKEQKNDLSQDS